MKQYSKFHRNLARHVYDRDIREISITKILYCKTQAHASVCKKNKELAFEKTHCPLILWLKDQLSMVIQKDSPSRF